MFKNILERKEAFPDDKNNYLKKVENLIKNWQFFHLLILDKTGKENVFSDMIKQKKRLSRLKTTTFKSQEIQMFLRARKRLFRL